MSDIPTLAEARATQPPPEDCDRFRPGEVVWGPIGIEEAAAAGSRMPSASVVLRGIVDDQLRTAALSAVPREVLQWPEDDSVKSLISRLAASTFLEDSHVLKGGGSGKRYIRLNETSYAQPRRRSWSVLVAPPHVDEDGDYVWTGLNYTAYGRRPSDWQCRPMPRPGA